MPLFLTPGSDIHLFLGGGTQTLVVLVLLSDTTVSEVGTDPHTHYDGFDPHVVTIAGATFAPVAAGDTVGIISFTDTGTVPPVVTRGAVRVRVHRQLLGLTIANENITIQAGNNDWVVTVYAQFDDLAMADVTAHGWLTWHFYQGGPVSVDAIGRISADAGAAGGQDMVRVAGGNFGAPVIVHVVPKLNFSQPILNLIRYRQPHTLVRNLLFLAEGYPDKDTFENDVRRITDILFSSPLHSPYHLLADRFNVWSAFQGTPAGAVGETGVTFAPSVTKDGKALPSFEGTGKSTDYAMPELNVLVGLPGSGSPTSHSDAQTKWATITGFAATKLSEDLFDLWKRQIFFGLTAPRNSTYGFMIGGRPCGPEASQPGPLGTVPFEAAHWDVLPTLAHRIISTDPRRVSPIDEVHVPHLHPVPALAFADGLDDYLSTLTYGTDHQHVDFSTSLTWQAGRADRGLVAFLVYDDVLGGTEITTDSGRIAFMSSLGNRQTVGLILPQSTTTPTSALARRLSLDQPLYEAVTGVVAHEFAHALGLSDEYENTDYIEDQMRAPAGDVANQIEAAGNLTHASNLRAPNPPHGIVRANVKWAWDRVDRASPLVAPAAMTPTGDAVTLQLVPGEGNKWSALRVLVTQVWLRPRDLNRFRTGSKFAPPTGPYTIRSVTRDTVVVVGPPIAASQFPAGSVLFAPAQKDGVTKKVIVTPVLDDLIFNGPFGVGDCATPNQKAEFPRGGISGFKYPKNKEEVIAVYEGGGRFNCDVFRPAGNCKMRGSDPEKSNVKAQAQTDTGLEHRRFCFVCRYLLVNEIFPGAFDVLDREYPEDC